MACGHPATAAAAREILRHGGNAFDAALAALCAAAVAEPVLCSLGGGGFLLAQRADGAATLYDFFVDTPRRKRTAGDDDVQHILADFGTTTQAFHIGLGTVATPGVIKGLFAVHRDLARLPMAEIVAPAAQFAREGVKLRPIDSYLFKVVAPILTARPEGRALFARSDGALYAEGDVLYQPDLAETLEALVRDGESLFYTGALGERLVADCAALGGHLSGEDLAGYRVYRRRPFERPYRDARILFNPPPSAGGLLIAFSLALLDAVDVAALGPATAALGETLARVMELTNRARAEASAKDVVDPAALLAPDVIARYRREVSAHAPATRGTTHISVVDDAGNIAALSVSNGEGCGYLLPGTGIHLNNMLGEEDVNPHGPERWLPGRRMASMMCPTIVTRADGAVAALGSGGSNRIRTAILQVLLNLIDFDLPLRSAVEAPRLHLESNRVDIESGFPEAMNPRFIARGGTVTEWAERNLFFGGVHAVARDHEGNLTAAADPRRAGHDAVI